MNYFDSKIISKLNVEEVLPQILNLGFRIFYLLTWRPLLK